MGLGMGETANLLIGGNDAGDFMMLAGMANRHGLIAGATGTGKTITLQNLAENFSRLGVPVFLADVKGDLSGLAKAGKPHPKIDARHPWFIVRPRLVEAVHVFKIQILASKILLKQ
jgi:DNA helicase HerA-like ATPase